MTRRFRTALGRVGSVAAGLGVVALALAWSVAHPARASLLLDGPWAHPCGTTTGGEPRRHSWVIRNDGTLPLRLRTRFTSGHSGFSLWLGEDHVVAAGRTLTVSLTCLTPTGGATPYSAHADLTTNDPESPWVRFRIFGITAPGPPAPADPVAGRPRPAMDDEGVHHLGPPRVR